MHGRTALTFLCWVPAPSWTLNSFWHFVHAPDDSATFIAPSLVWPTRMAQIKALLTRKTFFKNPFLEDLIAFSPGKISARTAAGRRWNERRTRQTPGFQTVSWHWPGLQAVNKPLFHPSTSREQTTWHLTSVNHLAHSLLTCKCFKWHNSYICVWDTGVSVWASLVITADNSINKNKSQPDVTNTEKKNTKGPYLYECQEDISWQAPSSNRFIFCSRPRTKCKTSIGNEFFQSCHFNGTESFLMHFAEPHQESLLKTGKYKSK